MQGKILRLGICLGLDATGAALLSLAFDGVFTIIPPCPPYSSCIGLLWPNYLAFIVGIFLFGFGFSRTIRFARSEVSKSTTPFFLLIGTGTIIGTTGAGLASGESSSCIVETTFPSQPGCRHVIFGGASNAFIGSILVALGAAIIVGASLALFYSQSRSVSLSRNALGKSEI